MQCIVYCCSCPQCMSLNSALALAPTPHPPPGAPLPLPAAIDGEVLHRRLAQQGESGHLCLDSHLLNSNNLLNEVAYQVMSC